MGVTERDESRRGRVRTQTSTSRPFAAFCTQRVQSREELCNFHMDFAVREIKICLPGPSALAVVFPRKQQSRAEEVICWLSAKSRHRFHGECFINFISRLHPVKETSLKSETPLFNSETRNFFFSSHSRKPTRCVAAPHCLDRTFAKNRSRLG